MKSFIIILSFVALVAVVFSAPTNFNMPNGPSFGNNQFEGGNENKQGQRMGQSDGMVRLQGFFQFYGFGELQQPSQGENNRPYSGFGSMSGNNQFGGPAQGGHGPGEGLKPSNENKTEEHGRPQHGFHFPTGVPGDFEGITGQPGLFGRPNVGNGNRRTPSTPSA